MKTQITSTPHPVTPNRKERKGGSVLTLALVISVVAGFITISYLQSALTGLRLSESILNQSSLLNLAEAGAEEALHAINHDEWHGWQTHDSQRVLLSQAIDLGRGYSGRYLVIVSDLSDNFARINVESQINDPRRDVPLRKQIQMELGARSLFANGWTSERFIHINGNNFRVDSFNSLEVPGGLYDAAYSRDNGSIGSVEVSEITTIDIGNSTIYGSVATAGTYPDFGPNAYIIGADTPSGVRIDESRVVLDFSAHLEPVSAPSTSGAITTLPSATGDVTTIGNPDGTVETYLLSELKLKNKDTLIIDGPVVIITDGEVDLRGEVQITENGSSTIYFGGDFTVAGNGMVNETNYAKNLVLFGTHTSPGSQLVLGGNAAMIAAIYAPKSAMRMDGGGARGRFIGAAVAYSITVNGGRSGYGFHYDEALADQFSSGSMRLLEWRELFRSEEIVDLSRFWPQPTERESEQETS
jgi:hypothetical protein